MRSRPFRPGINAAIYWIAALMKKRIRWDARGMRQAAMLVADAQQPVPKSGSSGAVVGGWSLA